ncbi:UDP-N-acetylmuramate dehydrogenase [Natroniella sulfidigena]|uniref:UDP-N-acetylmuramate dehydrogenase n=1 Tax=Natroniella sulfidigena TaxID=723921 RepID=UPI00200A1C2F|nr:UDP-N-acetylmuramate dehydrogenase [Natroniella sulfidigena]MCK8817336.1 UDP-N-acetylmuramate dehydrogenase [Natroniella sulfidigena]
MKQQIKQEIKKLVEGEVLFSEPLKKYTSFQIGGPAEVLVTPRDIADLQRLISYLYRCDIPYQVLGNGTNLLISDQGLSKVVIKMTDLFNWFKFKSNQLRAGAGAKLPVIAKKAAERGLSGLEFAAGLPASIGGAVIMNAGAGNLGSIGDLITGVKVISSTGELKQYRRNELDFSYRQSNLQKDEQIIIEVELELIPTDSKTVHNKMQKLFLKRKETQPLTMPNAGCIFKNPTDDSAGRLIDQAGGKGLKVGDAQVSTKHANFIVNLGSASAQDVLDLIGKVKKLVNEQCGVELETEIIYLS